MPRFQNLRLCPADGAEVITSVILGKVTIRAIMLEKVRPKVPGEKSA